MDVRPIYRSSVTDVHLGKQYTVLAAPKAHHTLSPLIPLEPHINGGESGLDGSVPDLRNRYFSFNLPYSQRLAFAI